MKQSPEISANFCGQLVFIQQRYQDDSIGGGNLLKKMVLEQLDIDLQKNGIRSLNHTHTV